MTRSTPIVVLIVTLLSGCPDPAEDAVAANVEDPSGSSAAPQSTEGLEAVAFSNEGSSVEWEGSKVTRTHTGRFGTFEGTIYLADSITDSVVSATIETSSIEADAARLTEHLRTEDFFDVSRFPRATFRSESIRAGGEGNATHTVRGQLELHGHTVSIEFPATIRIDAQRVRVDAEFVIDRQRFGIVYAGAPDDLIRDGVVIRLMIDGGRG